MKKRRQERRNGSTNYDNSSRAVFGVTLLPFILSSLNLGVVIVDGFSRTKCLTLSSQHDRSLPLGFSSISSSSSTSLHLMKRIGISGWNYQRDTTESSSSSKMDGIQSTGTLLQLYESRTTIDDGFIGGEQEQQQQQQQQQIVERRRPPIGRITSLDRSKLDTTVDISFYQNPNLVTHTDDDFIMSLQNVYRTYLVPNQPNNDNDNDDNDENNENKLVVLDLMSSHVSHYPTDVLSNNIRRVDVHGMNLDELRQNMARQSTGGKCFVRDLNSNPSLVGLDLLSDPFQKEQAQKHPTESNAFADSASNDGDNNNNNTIANKNTTDSGMNHTPSYYYDVVTCCVGIQYLQEPEAVLAEVGRILKPHTGIVIISFTNRFFYQKAIQGWIDRGMKERARLVQDCLRAAGGFDDNDIEIVGDGTSIWNQLGSLGGFVGDPFVAVVARRNGDP